MENKKTTLWTISDEFQTIIETLEENGGEITEELQQLMDESQESLLDKTDSYYAVLKSLSNEIKEIDEEIKSLQALKKAKENATKRIKENLAFFMQKFDLNKLEGKFHKISISTTKSINVDEDLMLSDYQDAIENVTNNLPPYISVELKISKTLIKDFEKTSGEMPKGAEWSENTGIRMR